MCSCIVFVLISREIFKLKIKSIFISGNQNEFFMFPAFIFRVRKANFSGRVQNRNLNSSVKQFLGKYQTVNELNANEFSPVLRSLTFCKSGNQNWLLNYNV